MKNLDFNLNKTRWEKSNLRKKICWLLTLFNSKNGFLDKCVTKIPNLLVPATFRECESPWITKSSAQVWPLSKVKISCPVSCCFQFNWPSSSCWTWLVVNCNHQKWRETITFFYHIKEDWKSCDESNDFEMRRRRCPRTDSLLRVASLATTD